jgi:23S rRNA (uridine2552-2'-O)-methyltransferase
LNKKSSYVGGEKFNKLSKKEGYRSRAAYKLKQINESHNLIKPNQNIMDIGSAPGSWSQVVKEIAKGKSEITAIDILPMQPIDGVSFIKKDLLEISDKDFNHSFDLVLSDIAPNISGISVIDSENMIELLNIEIYLINKLLAKCFQGNSFEHLKFFMKDKFEEVSRVKPQASRASSNECYLLGKKFKN